MSRRRRLFLSLARLLPGRQFTLHTGDEGLRIWVRNWLTAPCLAARAEDKRCGARLCRQRHALADAQGRVVGEVMKRR